MNKLTDKFHAMPEAAQWIILAASGAIAVLLLVIVIVALAGSISKGRGLGPAGSRVPSRLPYAPLLALNAGESLALRSIGEASRGAGPFTVHAKLDLRTIVGAHADAPIKIARAIYAKLPHQVLDYVIVGASGVPAAVITHGRKLSDEVAEILHLAGIPSLILPEGPVDIITLTSKLKRIVS